MEKPKSHFQLFEKNAKKRFTLAKSCGKLNCRYFGAIIEHREYIVYVIDEIIIFCLFYVVFETY